MLARCGQSSLPLLCRSSWALAGLLSCEAVGQAVQQAAGFRYYGDKAKQGSQWHWMVSQGHKVNPCNSMLHPAVKEAGILPEGPEEIAVQVAYTPKGHCFGCGEYCYTTCVNKPCPGSVLDIYCNIGLSHECMTILQYIRDH